jgi:hypothetical protein
MAQATRRPAVRHRRLAVTSTTLAALLATGLATVPGLGAAPAAAQDFPELPDGHVTHLVSRTAQGQSTEPYLTPDGQRVAFTSTAADLVDGDSNGVADVFLATAVQGDDPFSGTPVLVSRPDPSVGDDLADGPSGEPVASADGRYVAFSSTATNLVTGSTTPGRQHVYVRDTRTGTTFRVQADAEPNGSSYDPDLSDSGRYLVFTSEATDLVPGADGNDAPDAFLADLDTNGDGILGDLTITRFASALSIVGGTWDPVISGNGEVVAFTAGVPLLSGDHGPDGPVNTVYYGSVTDDGVATDAVPVLVGAREPAIDAAGQVLAYVDEVSCNDPLEVLHGEIVAVRHLGAQKTQWLGWALVDRELGEPHAPTVSADGGTVAWQTTQPRANFSNNPTEPLEHPVVRFEQISWSDAFTDWAGDPCTVGITRNDWFEIPTAGQTPSLSASGRTIALADPTTDPSSTTSVRVMDRHNHEGLWISAVAPDAPFLGYMAEADIGDIPLTQLRGYASALADAPIHRLPIHRLPIHRLPIHRLPIHRLLIDDSPIHRLPIHRLPIHRLPIHRLDIPGGWTELLAGTPFADELIHTVTLDEVLAWVEETLADGSGATPEEIAAAVRIRTLTLEDVDLSASGIDGLSLASFVLGKAPLAQVPLPGTGEVLARWQALLDAQGIALTLDEESVLAEADSSGLDIGRSRVDEVPLRDLPPGTLMDELLVVDLYLDRTPLGELDVSDLTPEAQTALFGPTVPAGTLAANQAALLDHATVADLASGAPESVTLGTLLLSVLDAESYPWEQIDTASIPHEAVERTVGGVCGAGDNCEPVLPIVFTFDAGPGEPTSFPAPTASVQLPAGTTVQDLITIRGTGPLQSWRSGTAYPGPVQIDGELVRFPFADTPSGTALTLGISYTVSVVGPTEAFAEAHLRSGGKSAEFFMWLPDQRQFDDPSTNRNPDGTWESEQPPEPLLPGRIYYDTIKPAYIDFDEDLMGLVVGPADDEDYFLVPPPPPGHRLVVSTNATDGQVVLELYAPTAGASPELANAGPAPGVGVTEPSGPATAGTTVGPDAGVAIDGLVLVDQVKTVGGALAQIEAAAVDVGSNQNLLLRVTSGTGRPTDGLYSIRVRHVPEPAETRCAPRTMTQPGEPGESDPVAPGTNTLVLIDTQRFTDAYGATATAELLADLADLNEVDGVRAAVVAVDASQTVRDRRADLDANPCSMSARRDLARAINTYVRDHVGASQLPGIESVVLVGGDDMLPHVPVPQRTSQFNEASHASTLRLPAPPGGGTCPGEVPAGEVDPCATPLSAAAATNHILTDDAYGLATAYRSLGGYFYVPTVGVGRLVETPEQISATVQRFVDAEGLLPGDSTLTGGYGAWAELPDQITEELVWRTDPANRHTLTEPWDRDAVTTALGEDPVVVSINTHADETRMLPGIPGAPLGRFAEADLLTTADLGGLAEAIVFLIGCHAAQNLPSGYYGDVPDWSDVFSQAGGFVGNTGFGLANNVTTALSERLLRLYAAWLGAQVGGQPVTTGQALAYAKQSYLGGLGLYSGYDEKVLMQAVYYGLPMYTLANSTKELPLPTIPSNLSEIGPADEDGLSHASLVLSPEFETVTDTETGETYETVDGQDPLVVAGQPILPRVVHQLRARPVGLVPRGALITGLSSVQSDLVVPAIAEPSVGTPDTGVYPPGTSFPSTFATISHQDTPAGVVDLLVVTPGRVQLAPDGQGRLERFTSMTFDITYAPSASADATPPVFTLVEPPQEGSGLFRVTAQDTGSAVTRMVLLVQPLGVSGGPWESYELVHNEAFDNWTVWVDEAETGPVRWILQSVDGGGNVAVESGRGQLPVAAAAPPTIPAQQDATVLAGGRLQRTVTIGGVGLGETLTGRYSIRVPVVGSGDREPLQGVVLAGGPLTVSPGAGGTAQAVLDTLVPTPGVYEVVLEVCRGASCAQQAFGLTVEASNNPPSVIVTLSSNTPEVTPTSVLTAVPVPSDPDGDPVTLSYAWARNGVAIAGESGPTLDLASYATPGATFTVTVTPHDGKTAGHAGVASVVLGETLPPPPEGPTITAAATAGGQPYVEGEWSRVPVTVSFTCTADPPGSACPAPVTVSADTSTDGQLVTGTVTDGLGRTATAQLLVRVDGTPPELSPTVTPATVPVGGTATASANAVDASSGVQTEECDPVDTSAAGTFQVECRATDVAGNTSTGAASYEVVPVDTGDLTVTVEATSRGRAYQEGTWADGPVQVKFRCESDVRVLECPRPVTVPQDTGPDGQRVTGTARDAAGRTVTVEFLVRVDKTPPQLSPSVTPSTVPVGGTATASPNATDIGSGVASATCDPVDTSKTGKKQVWCYATDHVGNSAKAKASYTVVKAGGPSSGLTVTVRASAGKSTYAEETWSRHAVKVTFTCTSDVKVTSCPKPVTVSKDTGPQGVLVAGTARDKHGRTATATIVIRVDRTPPRLSPTVVPEKVPVGGEAAVVANAGDKASGVVSWSCGVVSTAKKGKHTVVCQATDAAGNTAKAKATYTVVSKAEAPKPPKKPKDPKPPKDRSKDKKKDDKKKDKDKKRDKKPKDSNPKQPEHADRVVRKVIERFWGGWD